MPSDRVDCATVYRRSLLRLSITYPRLRAGLQWTHGCCANLTCLLKLIAVSLRNLWFASQVRLALDLLENPAPLTHLSPRGFPMHRSSRLIALAALSAATFAPALAPSSTTAVAHAEFKIAVVDMQRALHETEDGRKAKATLKRLFEDRQKTLDKQQNDVKTLKESLDKQQNILTPDVLAKKQEELQKAFMELQQTYGDYQRELQTKEGELTRDIIERMQRIMRHVGQTEGYSLVLERNESGVVYVTSDKDLTDVLIQRYNAGEGKEATAAAPAPAAAAKPKSK